MNLGHFPRQQQRPAARFPVPLQVRVQYAALLQLAEHGTVDSTTTVDICPGTDRWDLEAALKVLLDEKSIKGPTWRGLSSLVTLAAAGRLSLTQRGQQRLNEDDI